mmetsp:Transcript_12539/g.29693  ORF Transcript_12539/g.29693 Transcript_12539/m.29693 type:complete len:389 (+) Transcript_12539:1044-2210(+)
MVRHNMVARGRALIFRIWVSTQWTNAVPSRHDVSSAHLQIGRQVLFTLVDQILNLVLGHFVMQIRLCFHIRGANKRVALPWEEEEERASGSHHVNHSDVPGAVVRRKDNVCTSRSIDHGLHILPLTQLPQTVCERPTTVDDLLGLDSERLGSWICLVKDLCASGHTFLVEHDSLNLGIVGDARPVHCRSEGDADIGAGIVVLTLIENGNVLHPLPVHLWEICSCPFRRHDVRVGRDILPQKIIEFEEDHEETRTWPQCGRRIIERRWPNDPLVQRNGNRNPIGDVGVHRQHVGSFTETSQHHMPGSRKLAPCCHWAHQGRWREQLHQALHEVPRAGPKELRGFGRSPRCEVFLLDARYLQSSELSLQSDSSACCTAANHQDVKLFSAC